MYKIKSIIFTFVLLLIFTKTKAQFSGFGTGTESDPFQIANATQLDEVRNYLGSANNDKHFQLKRDIDMADLIAEKYPIQGWYPIGNQNDGDSEAFTGSLDGNGFMIKNLWISRPENDYIGLFGRIKEGSITNVNIHIGENGIRGGNYVGAVSGGIIDGSVINSKMTGTINAISDVGGLIGNTSGNTLIKNNFADSVIHAEGDNAGGLIGQTSAAVTNCHSSGTVNTFGNYSGGLIGIASAPIIDCSSSSNVKNMGSIFVGNFMGGLVGAARSTVTNSHASGEVVGVSVVGGLVGDSYALISNSYATGKILGNAWVGGLVGASDNVENCYATGNTMADLMNVGGLAGQAYGTVSYSKATGNVNGAQGIGGLIGVANQPISYSYATGNVAQTSVPEEGFADIGGLVGFAFSGASIQNCFAAGNVTVTDENAMYIGGLVGISDIVSNSYAYGSVSGGYSLVGGLVGDAMGPISNSAAINPSVMSSPMGNFNKVHRLVGDIEFEGEIINSYALDQMELNGQTVADGTDGDLNALNKSIAELQQQATYGTGLSWDFANVWKIREGHGYPYLQSSEYLTSVISADINNGSWGTVSPKGILSLKDGSSKIFDITPNSGYEIESVLVDNENIGKPDTYTFSNIVENHTILVIFKLISLSTNETKAKNINVYPNPTADRIFVSGNKKVTSLELYNITGQKVLQSNENSMDLTSLTAGVYILKIKTENSEISSSKIIKK